MSSRDATLLRQDLVFELVVHDDSLRLRLCRKWLLNGRVTCPGAAAEVFDSDRVLGRLGAAAVPAGGMGAAAPARDRALEAVGQVSQERHLEALALQRAHNAEQEQHAQAQAGKPHQSPEQLPQEAHEPGPRSFGPATPSTPRPGSGTGTVPPPIIS